MSIHHVPSENGTMNLSFVWAELSRRPARTLAGLLSVSVGVALFISLAAYATAYREAARFPLTEIGANVVAQRQGTVPKAFRGIVLPHSTAPIHRSEVDAVRSFPGVQEVGEAIFFWDFEPGGFVIGMGLDPASAVADRMRAGLRAGRFLRAGDHDVAVVDATYAAQQHLTIGGTVDVGGKSVTTVGIVETAQAGQLVEANLYLLLADARALVAAAPNVRAVHDIRTDDDDILYVRTDPAHTVSVAAQLTQLLGKTAIVTTPRSFEEVLGSTFALIDRFGALVGAAGLVVAMAGLLRAAAAGLWERRRDIGLMRAVGWRRRDVIAQVAVETLILTALGEVVGLSLAAVVAWGLRWTRVMIPVPWEVMPTPHFLPGGAAQVAVAVPLDARIHAAATLGPLAAGLIGGVLVSTWVARRAAAVKPAEVWRHE
jgi:lipoprotein-releasing system permease protein